MKKVIELSLLVSLLITAQQAAELNFDNESRMAISISTDSLTTNQNRAERPTTRVSPRSKLLKIKNSIRSLEFQIEQFPDELEAFKVELTEHNTKNAEILDAINQHLLTEQLGDSDNPVIRKNIKEHYTGFNFGDDLIRMRGKVEQMITIVKEKIKDADVKVAAIPGLVKIRNGLLTQQKLLKGDL